MHDKDSAVEAEWRRMGELTSAIKPLEIQIMPDHIHFILRVTERLARPLGLIIAGFKTGSSKAATGKPGFWSEGIQDTIMKPGNVDGLVAEACRADARPTGRANCGVGPAT